MADRIDLGAIRSRRDAARGALDSRLNRVKGDFSARGIASRLADDARKEALETLDTAIDIAKESKGVIAGTAVLLGLWFMRNPIIAWIESQFAEHRETKAMPDEQHPTGQPEDKSPNA